MNIINPTSRQFLCQHINGSTFAADLSNYTTYYQINSIEKTKLIEVIEVSTITEASRTSEIRAQVSGSQVQFTHPFNTWVVEGFVVGDTVRIEANGNSSTGTVKTIVGAEMYVTDATFIADLGVTDGDKRADYVIKSTTVPTSLIWKYGINPNDLDSPDFNSPLTGEPQVYAANGITGSLTDILYTGQARSDMGTVQAKYDGASGTGNYIFTFTVEHVFQNPYFIESWLINYSEVTLPETYRGIYSYGYVCEMTFGTNINNPNETKTFLDAFQTGSSGLFDQNFNARSTNYTIDSIAYTGSLGGVLDSIDADDSTNIAITIQKNNGSWTAGERAYFYHAKLPTQTEYSAGGRDEVATTQDVNFVFGSHSNIDGAVKSSNGFIKNLLVVINGGDPTKLDITLTLTYAAAQTDKISNLDNYFLGVGVEDSATTATTSDRTIVWCDQNTWIKTTDITGLITVPQINFYNSTQVIGVATPTSAIDSYDGSLWQLTGSFRLTKVADSADAKLISLEISEVGYYAANMTFFKIQSFVMPLSNRKGGPTSIDVGDTLYQVINTDETRNLANLPSDDALSAVKVDSVIPGSFQIYQEFTWQLGWQVGWRDWVFNPDVKEVAPEFYDITELNDNFNQRSSNYSGVNNYEIYFFATAVVEQDGIETTYHLNSDQCEVVPFGTDILTTGWAIQSIKYYDENGIESTILFPGQDMQIIIIIDNPGALLTLANVGGEIMVEISDSETVASRLHSVKDWSGDDNMLKPVVGSSLVDVTQVAGAPNEVHLTCLIKGEMIDEKNDYNFSAMLNAL